MGHRTRRPRGIPEVLQCTTLRLLGRGRPRGRKGHRDILAGRDVRPGRHPRLPRHPTDPPGEGRARPLTALEGQGRGLLITEGPGGQIQGRRPSHQSLPRLHHPGQSSRFPLAFVKRGRTNGSAPSATKKPAHSKYSSHTSAQKTTARGLLPWKSTDVSLAILWFHPKKL